MSRRLVLAVIALSLSGLWMQPPSGRAATVDRIVAVVNGEIITFSDLQSAAALARLGLLSLSSDGTISHLQSSEHELLEQLINQRLQLQLARKKGIAVGPEEVEKAVEDVKQKNGMMTDAALQKALKEEQANLDQYKNGLKDQIMILKLVNREVKSGVVLSEEEMRSYYEAHSDRFLTPMQYRLHQILIPIPDPGSVQTAEQTARNVADQLKTGADFQTMIKRYSNGPEVKGNGDLGTLRADQMLPEIRRAVEPLKPGEFSAPVKTAAGVHIFRLDEIQPPKSRAFEEVKAEIQERLFQEQSADLYEKWLKDLRASGQVEIKF
ncbi:MAG: peptidyl-prolyl cis-trans isomerase [Nitrospirae bacterium]|nr:peptidyl-prolyl cis-trans isomerase [Nitrospirota bacterium]